MIQLMADSNVLNLATLLTLSPAQTQLLEKGLSFVPRPTKWDREELLKDVHKYHRRIKILDHFRSQTDYQHQLFTYQSNWEPTLALLDKNTQKLIKLDNHSLRTYQPPADVPDNLSGAERRGLKQLLNNPNIIIKPADKGSKVIILDRQQYLQEANRQLADTKYYKPIPQSIQHNTQTQLRGIVQSLHQKKYITAKQRDYLYGPNNPRPRQFYLLPKIHKDPKTWTVPYSVPPGRPIISDCNSTSYNITQYIDHFLNPLSTKHPSYIKDTYHFLDIIRPMTVPIHTYLFTIDIDSLYTNINTNLGIKTIESIFQRYPDCDRPDKEIIQLLTICLHNNDFCFNDQHYLQINGTAMGQRYAPSYANIYMSEWEREALAKCPLKPLFYFRYLDDIIGAWPHDITHFPQFIEILNNHHPSIKIKHCIDPYQVNFLDTTIFFQKVNNTSKKMLTKVYFKTTDTHALLHKNSYHPKHTFKGIIKSQIIRFHRISSLQSDLQESIRTLFKSLRKRNYSKRFLRSIKNSTLASLAPTRSHLTCTHNSTHKYTHITTQTPGHNTSTSFPLSPPSAPSQSLHSLPSYPKQGLYPYPNLDPRKERGSNTQNKISHAFTSPPPRLLPLVSTFSHRIIGLHHSLKNNFINIQTQHPVIQNHRVISAYRKNPSLQNILVRTKFSSHNKLSDLPDNKYYKDRKFIYNPYSSSSFPPQTSFSLTYSNIVYIITCTICNKHYIGETKHSLHTRLKQHLYNIKKGQLETLLIKHFQTHSLDYLIISGLESNPNWTTGQRKRAERIWIERLGTTTPRGLNDTS